MSAIHDFYVLRASEAQAAADAATLENVRERHLCAAAAWEAMAVRAARTDKSRADKAAAVEAATELAANDPPAIAVTA
jgi:hypothetical protein